SSSRPASSAGGGDARSRDDQGQEQNVSASNSVIETTRYPETSRINTKSSALDHSISRSSSPTDPFNNLINVCATAILVAILVLLELHIRRSILHSHPAVVRSTNEAVPGISLQIPAQANAVAR